ncbi:hypothetical protein [Variovorax terrae]|uniref:Uncharacterized protein n=1 Tax=Variovorax terrae TaxID=2923278 RepID=A0A9X1VQK4_9BURK|nr:hypothetical protein [Variovorax terrae]MCJ0762001.1 hypothetical protein [Variovorax terrae]
MTPSRLSIDPSTQLPHAQSFSELSHFLRSAVADEETLQLGDSMGLLASHIEAIVAALKQGHDRAAVAPLLMDLLTILREHRALVIGLNTAWRGLYEYASYLAALNNFRVLIGQWLLDKDGRREPAAGFEDFELIAWRTLGEGMLLIDIYDQWRGREQQESALGTLEDPRAERARNWWSRLRG